MGDTVINRHPHKKLTVKFIEAAKIPGKYFDGHGLFLKINKSGTKQWVQRIVINGKRSEIGLGSANVVGLQDARKTALDNRAMARSGIDPLAHRKAVRAIPDFETATYLVHQLHSPSWKNQKHSAQFTSTLESYVFPYLAKKRIDQITTSEVLKPLNAIWLEKPETARRIMQRISRVFKWSIAEGFRLDNPAENLTQVLPKQNDIQIHMRALPYNQTAECIESIYKSGAFLSSKLALEFLILTACRSGELSNAQWAHIHPEHGTTLDQAERAFWVRPASMMKSNREHTIPLSKRCMEILRTAKAVLSSDTDLIFPSRRGKPISNMTLLKLVKSIGYDIHVHGFRTTFKIWCQEQTNISREISEMALAHSIKDKSEAAYARSEQLEKRRNLMENWSSYISLQKPSVVAINVSK